MSKIIISAFADEYDHDPKLQAEFLESRGVSFIEPRFISGRNIANLTADEAEEYAALLAKHGVRAFAIGSPLGKINLADDFEAHLELAKNCFNNAVIMGAKYIRMFSFYLRDGQTPGEARCEVIEQLGRLIDLADEYGLTLCHENEANIYGESPDRCLDILTAFGGRLKAVFDMGNFVLDGHNPYPDAYELLKDYIAYFHIKDSMSAGAIVPAGLGEARIADVLAAHKAYTDSDIVVTLEPHLETFDGLNKLASKSFENPYKFETPKIAFSTALDKLEEILAKIG